MKVERWTNAAIECWRRGCVCKGCFYERFFATADFYTKCKMKQAVIDSVRCLGIPPGEKEKTISKDE